MVIKQYFEDAKEFLSGELACSIVLIFRSKEDDTLYTFGRLNLEEDVQTKVRKIFLKRYRSWHKNHESFTFKKYDAQASGDDILYLPIGEVQSPLLTKSIEDIEQLTNLTDEAIENLWGYIIHFTNSDAGELRVFVKYSPGKVLRKSRFDALFMTRGSFKPIDHDVFNMVYRIHAASFGDYLVIPAKYNFEQLFQMEKQIEKNAKEALKKVKNLGFTFENFSAFEKDCMKMPTAQRKLSNLQAQADWGTLDFPKVAEMKKKYKLSFSIDEEKKSLSYSNRDEMWEVLHLLDDSLLHSERTRRRYEVGTKVRRA